MGTTTNMPKLTINTEEVKVLIEEFNGEAFRKITDELELQILSACLIKNYGNQTRTAEQLGLNRGTLRKKMIAHGMIDKD